MKLFNVVRTLPRFCGQAESSSKAPLKELQDGVGQEKDSQI